MVLIQLSNFRSDNFNYFETIIGIICVDIFSVAETAFTWCNLVMIKILLTDYVLQTFSYWKMSTDP